MKLPSRCCWSLAASGLSASLSLMLAGPLRADEPTPRGVMSGHGTSVFDVAFSPDGKTLASSGSDGVVRLWDVATRKPLRTLEYADAPPNTTSLIMKVAFTPDGKSVAADAYGNVVFWDVVTGKQLREIDPKKRSGVTFFDLSPDGETLAATCFSKDIVICDVQTGKTLRELHGHTDTVEEVAFSPDGKLLASAGKDGTVRLWRPDSGREVAKLKGGARGLAFSPDGKRLASGQGVVRVWGVADGRLIAEHEPARVKGFPPDQVTDVAFSPDGERLAITHRSWVEIYLVGENRLLNKVPAHPIGSAVAFSPDGLTLATAGHDGFRDGAKVTLWDLSKRMPPGER